MSFDVTALLAPCSDEAPCGANLEYDPDFMELETVAQGKPEQQFGDIIVPAEEPEWDVVGRSALALATRTKDLRIAYLLTRASLNTQGLPGLIKGLELLRGYIVEFWQTLHPQLDPDDGNDPTLRINVIESFAGQGVIINPLRSIPLLTSRLTGPVSLRDISLALGKEQLPEGTEPPKFGDLEAIFSENHPEQINEAVQLASVGAECIKEIEGAVAVQTSGGESVDLSKLAAVFREVKSLLSPWLARTDSEPSADLPQEDSEIPDEISPGTANPSLPASRAARKGINSRDDVIRSLEEICRYYEQNEPSSPVPILLNRARRWVKKDFLSLIQEIAPDGMSDVDKLVGPID